MSRLGWTKSYFFPTQVWIRKLVRTLRSIISFLRFNLLEMEQRADRFGIFVDTGGSSWNLWWKLVLFNIQNGRIFTYATQCFIEWWLLDEQ